MDTSQKITVPVIGGTKADTTESFSVSNKDLATPQLIAQYVKMYLHNQRQGTASAKDRSQVAGTTHKMYKQKGTGNARHGSAKAPIFKGGGVVGGPTPKTYESKMSKKQKGLVYITILQGALSQNIVALLDKDSETKTAKTKEFAAALKESFGAKQVTFVVDAKENTAIARSARNVSHVEVIHADRLSPFDILKSKQLLFTHAAWRNIVSRLS